MFTNSPFSAIGALLFYFVESSNGICPSVDPGRSWSLVDTYINRLTESAFLKAETSCAVSFLSYNKI